MTDRPIDRRAVFFLGASAACFVLAAVAGSHTHIAVAVGAVYVVLALASWLDHRSRWRS